MRDSTKKKLELVMAQVIGRGLVSRQDIQDLRLPAEYLAKLAEAGLLNQLAPGVYMDVDADVGELLELAVVAKRVPRAIFFGITALQFHGLTSQVAHAVEFAVERDTWTPKLAWPSIDVFHLSGDSFSTGVEEHVIEGDVPIRVYSVAKTVADLFKFRSRFGLDVAIEALKEGWRERRFTLAQLDACAKACRVSKVMRPYLEMLS